MARSAGTPVVRRELDDAMLEQLEELLISADMGVDTALRVSANLAEGRFGRRVSTDEIKDLLCERTGYISDCGDSMLLEMVQVDPRAWSAVSANATCVDKSEEVQPKTIFKNDAKENELMILRACAKVDPVFPTTWLGANLVKDGAGQFAITAMSAFVQEPR